MGVTAPPPPPPPPPPPAPPWRPPGSVAEAALPPLRSDASVLSQALAAGAFALVFAGLGVRMGSATWFVAPTVALLIGVVLGVGLDLRRFVAVVPGFVAALITLVGLIFFRAVATGSAEGDASLAAIPLIALVVFGTDWWWVERLRPIAVASGVGLVFVLHGELGETLPLALGWFAVVAAALWSLRRDAGRQLPTPVPLDGSPGPSVEPGVGRTAAAVAVAWLAAAGIVALASLVPLWVDSPRTAGRLSGDVPFGPPGAPGGGSGPGGSGVDPGLGPTSLPAIEPGEVQDVNGDGILDRDIDGDGVLDVDLDGDGIPDVDVNGDGIPDDLTAPNPVDGTDPTTPGTVPDAGGGDGGSTSDVADGVLRILGVVVVVLLAVVIVVLIARSIAQALARRRALAARPWAVRLAERIEAEGARRGRGRRRDEPVTGYVAALAGGPLAHDRMAEVGVALSAALFGPRPADGDTEAWAVGVVDEAVAANPPPSWRDRFRAKRRP